jgi:hypothetical protein
MSEYKNVIGGRLKLKGKALDVKEGGVKKKKRSISSKSRLSMSTMSSTKVCFSSSLHWPILDLINTV